MNFKTLKTFAFLNLKANKTLNIPFVFANGLSFALLFVMTSLINNDYVNKRSAFLPYVISIGLMIVSILTIVFFLYTNNFLMKRRHKELALYAILGLEEKHVVIIIAFEHLILLTLIAIFSIFGGYILGKLAFAILLKLINVKVSLFNYQFSSFATITNIVLLSILYLIINLNNIYKFKKYSLIELKALQESNESEPKTNFFLLLIGFLSLY